MALAIGAFALVAIFGLLPIGVTSNRNSVEQTIAAGVATAVVADLRATPAVPLLSGTSAVYKIPIPASGGGIVTTFPPAPSPASLSPLYLKEDGSVQTVSTARYQINVTLTPPAAGKRTATIVRLLVTWPASATVAPPNYSGSFEVLTALNRN